MLEPGRLIIKSGKGVMGNYNFTFKCIGEPDCGIAQPVQGFVELLKAIGYTDCTIESLIDLNRLEDLLND